MLFKRDADGAHFVLRLFPESPTIHGENFNKATFVAIALLAFRSGDKAGLVAHMRRATRRRSIAA